ncbi:hypothetical protein BASA81_008582 [Batrachochytrium salamandrivorans]|nr:hypothetical protein BASA81_008582 [Batrachochytrium salamandrivorans]
MDEFHESLLLLRRPQMMGWRTNIRDANLALVWSMLVYLLLWWCAIPNDFSSQLYFDYDHANGPLARFHFQSFDNQHVQFPLPSTQFKRKSPFVLGERYQIGVELALPRTEVNLKSVGVFMVEVEFEFNSTTSRMLHSKRPCLVPHRTETTRLLEDIVLAPVRILTGWFPARDLVQVIMFDSWQAQGSVLGVSVRLSCSLPPVQVANAKLYADVILSGYRYWLVKWFWTSALWWTRE